MSRRGVGGQCILQERRQREQPRQGRDARLIGKQENRLRRGVDRRTPQEPISRKRRLVEDKLHFIVVEECAGNRRIRYELPTAYTAVPPGPDEE